MLQDLSASVFFPPCSQHRTLGVYGILKKYYFLLFFFFFIYLLLNILHAFLLICSYEIVYWVIRKLTSVFFAPVSAFKYFE